MVHIRKKWLEQLLSGAHFVRSICGQLIWYIVGLLTKGLGWPVGFGSRYIPFHCVASCGLQICYHDLFLFVICLPLVLLMCPSH
jgi:hypothetical protein